MEKYPTMLNYEIILLQNIYDIAAVKYISDDKEIKIKMETTRGWMTFLVYP